MSTKNSITNDQGDIDLDETEVTLDDGTRLTEARAEQYANELEERHNKGGRPSLSGGSKRSPQIGIRLGEDLDAKLRAKADAEGKRVSDVVREAIEAHVS